MMKKNGFTLVEIMVAAIIVGILAAVGVPKLFGVIAKAKAAEVPVAAGTYISLQNTGRPTPRATSTPWSSCSSTR